MKKTYPQSFIQKHPAHRKKRHKEKSPHWPFVVLIICIPAFLVFSSLVLHELLRYQAEDRANTMLAQEIRNIRDGSETSSDNLTNTPPFGKKTMILQAGSL